ncbi:hypothetical protein PGB90_004392 [Kerria lacca]
MNSLRMDPILSTSNETPTKICPFRKKKEESKSKRMQRQKLQNAGKSNVFSTGKKKMPNNRETSKFGKY